MPRKREPDPTEVNDMRGPWDEQDSRHEEGARCETTFGAYCSARDRFFATLQADAETRRLEKAWSMPAREPWPRRPPA